jgi:hypothetical protein
LFHRNVLCYRYLISNITHHLGGEGCISNWSNRSKARLLTGFRNDSLDGWLTTAKTLVEVKELRPGKKVWTGSLSVERGLDRPLRIVFRVIERSLSPTGQALLVPDIEVDTCWTLLTDFNSWMHTEALSF